MLFLLKQSQLQKLLETLQLTLSRWQLLIGDSKKNPQLQVFISLIASQPSVTSLWAFLPFTFYIRINLIPSPFTPFSSTCSFSSSSCKVSVSFSLNGCHNFILNFDILNKLYRYLKLGVCRHMALGKQKGFSLDFQRLTQMAFGHNLLCFLVIKLK